MSKTATSDKTAGNKTNANSCCGGPALNDANACCVRDADAKATGASGCGCSSGSHPGDPKATCCA